MVVESEETGSWATFGADDAEEAGQPPADPAGRSRRSAARRWAGQGRRASWDAEPKTTGAPRRGAISRVQVPIASRREGDDIVAPERMEEGQCRQPPPVLAGSAAGISL